MIPYGHQDINDDDIAAVVRVLRSDRITQGEAVQAFEQKLCEVTGAHYAVSTNSATSALHLACLVLGVSDNSLVWTSANTFVASANCARFVGATVDFVDIDPTTGNLSIEVLEQKLSCADRLPDVLVAVHFAGQSCDMQAIGKLAERFGFRVIEDASHALGAQYLSGSVGSCEYSDITVFSFHPVKIATTGEGGALLCNDQRLFRHAQQLRSHGVTREREAMQNPQADSWVYEQLELGFNYRMTDIQAALGCSQLERLSDFVRKRREIASVYVDAFAQRGINHLSVGAESSVHLFVLQVNAEARARIYKQLQASGIGVNVHYMPVYWQPYYQDLGFKRGHCPASEHYYQQAITLPLYPGLSDEQQHYVIDQVTQAVG